MARERLTLQAVLKKHNVKELRKVASGYYITGTSKMRKDDLAAAVEQALLEPGRFEKILLMVDASCWRLIQDLAVADGPLPVSPELIKYANMFSQLGYLQYDEDDHVGTVEMPVEIKSLLAEMERDGFPARKAQADMLHAYTQAAVNLYGLIEAEELVDIINRQNEKKIDYGELLLSQLPHLELDALYRIWDDYLVRLNFEENNFKDIPNFLSAIAGKPRYVPKKDKFLRHADWSYYDKTPHTDRLKSALMEGRITSEAAEEIVSAVVISLQSGMSVSDVLQLLMRQGIVIHTDALPTFSSMISAIYNTTRLWVNKGHTPAELAQMRNKFGNNSLRQAPEKIKIGRNDPCPCGSGKKYKKCCGR